MFLALFLKKTGFPGGSVVKNLPTNAEAAEAGSIPGLVRSPGEGNGKPLQYSCLENPMDRGNWWARVHGVAKSWTRLSVFTHKHYNELKPLFLLISIIFTSYSRTSSRTPTTFGCYAP